MRINLGAGNDIKPDYVNHDIRKHRPEINVVHDLNVLPWPWGDNVAEEILANSVFEHLQITLIQALDECWRILQVGGWLRIKYPLYVSDRIHDDPTHRWYWSNRVLEFVCPGTKYHIDAPYYTERKWKMLDSHESERNFWAVLTPIK